MGQFGVINVKGKSELKFIVTVAVEIATGFHSK